MALDFLAELNQRGGSRSTYELYIHVVWDFHRHAGQVLGLKLKRRKTLLPYIPWSHVERLLAAAQRMGDLIDHLLSLSRVTRREMNRETVDFSSERKDSVEKRFILLRPRLKCFGASPRDKCQ